MPSQALAAERRGTDRNGEGRRAQLVRIGGELFGSRAYDDVWIEEIAERAGISRGLLYHYFPSKRDFYVAVVQAETDRVAELTEPDPALPPAEQLNTALDAYLDYVERHPQGILTTLRGGVGSDPEVRAILEVGQARTAERILAALPEGLEAPESLRLAVRGWVGFLEATLIEWLRNGSPERERVRDLLVAALAAIVQAARD